MQDITTFRTTYPKRNITPYTASRSSQNSPVNNQAASVEPSRQGDVFIRFGGTTVKIEVDEDVWPAMETPQPNLRRKRTQSKTSPSPTGKGKRLKPQQNDTSSPTGNSPPKTEPGSGSVNLLSSFQQAPTYYLLKESDHGIASMVEMRHATINGTPVFVFNDEEGTFLQALEPTTKYYYRTPPDPYSKTIHCPLWQDYTEQTHVVKTLADPNDPKRYNPDYELRDVKMTPQTEACYRVPSRTRFYRQKKLKIEEAIAENEAAAKRYVLADMDITNGKAVKNRHAVQNIDSRTTELSTGQQEMIYATKSLTGDGVTPLGAYRGVPNPFDPQSGEYDQAIEAHLQDKYGPFYRSFTREVDWVDPETHKEYQFKISAAGSSGLMHKVNVPLKTNVVSELDYNLKEVNAPVSNYYAVFQNRKKKSDIVVMPLALKHIEPGMTIPKDHEILTDYGEDFLIEVLLPEIKEANSRRVEQLKQEASNSVEDSTRNPFTTVFRPGKRMAAIKAREHLDDSESDTSSAHAASQEKSASGSDDAFMEGSVDHGDSERYSTKSEDNDYSDVKKEESEEEDYEDSQDSSTKHDYAKHKIPYDTRRFLDKELYKLIIAYPSLTPKWLNAEDMPTAIAAAKLAIKHTDWSQGDIAKELTRQGHPIDPGTLGKWGISHGEKSLALWQEAKELKKQYPKVTPRWESTKNRLVANEAVKLAIQNPTWSNMKIAKELTKMGHSVYSGTLGRWGIGTAETSEDLLTEAARLKEKYPVLTEDWLKSPFRSEANTAVKLVVKNPSIKQQEIMKALVKRGLREVSQTTLSGWGINKLKEFLAGASEERMDQLQEQLPSLTPAWRGARDKKLAIRAAEIAIKKPKLRQGQILALLRDEGFTLSKTTLHDWGIRVTEPQEAISPETVKKYRTAIPELTDGWENAKSKSAAIAAAQYIIDHPYASPQPRIVADLAKMGHILTPSSLHYWGIIAALKKNIEAKQKELLAKRPGLTSGWINAHDKEEAFAAAELSINNPRMSQRNLAKELKKQGYKKMSQGQLSSWGIRSQANDSDDDD